ncbi:hypothetical protein M3221_20810, partial [Domibacillus indicus]|uniref:hypothetical protein n=1 Tax=Domibacillus indicus TaxID=1437523 RepID=UPI0020425508
CLRSLVSIMHSGFRRKLNPLMLYRIQDKGCSIKIFDLGGEVHRARKGTPPIFEKVERDKELTVPDFGAV